MWRARIEAQAQSGLAMTEFCRRAVAARLLLKDKVGDLLKTQPGPWPEIRDKLNRTLSGWKNYFHYGSVRSSYQAIDHHVRTKVRNFLQRRHKDPSRGTHQFSHTVIFKEYGVFEMAKR